MLQVCDLILLTSQIMALITSLPLTWWRYVLCSASKLWWVRASSSLSAGSSLTLMTPQWASGSSLLEPLLLLLSVCFRMTPPGGSLSSCMLSISSLCSSSCSSSDSCRCALGWRNCSMDLDNSCKTHRLHVNDDILQPMILNNETLIRVNWIKCQFEVSATSSNHVTTL